MIDTIKLHLPPELIPAYYFKNHEHLFTHYSKKISEIGEITFEGQFKNLKISQNSRGLTVTNSLSRYYLGTNQKALRLTEIEKAFTQLATELQLPILEAKVKRIDLAENIITTYPVKEYFKVMGEAKYFQRLEMNHGLEYRNVYRTVVFYDKMREVNRKKENETEVLKGRNVIRVEYKFLQHQPLADYLNLKRVTVKDVIENYQKLVDGWISVFTTINKKHGLITFNPEVFKAKGGLDKQIRIIGVEALGGLQAVITMIKEARGAHLFKYPNEPTYLLQKFTTLMKTPKLTEKSTLANEMERKVKIVSFVASNREYLWA